MLTESGMEKRMSIREGISLVSRLIFFQKHIFRTSYKISNMGNYCDALLPILWKTCNANSSKDFVTPPHFHSRSNYGSHDMDSLDFFQLIRILSNYLFRESSVVSNWEYLKAMYEICSEIIQLEVLQMWPFSSNLWSFEYVKWYRWRKLPCVLSGRNTYNFHKVSRRCSKQSTWIEHLSNPIKDWDALMHLSFFFYLSMPRRISDTQEKVTWTS